MYCKSHYLCLHIQVRIAEGEHPKDIKESNYFTPQGEFRVDKSGSKTLLNCLMYKMSYYRYVADRLFIDNIKVQKLIVLRFYFFPN